MESNINENSSLEQMIIYCKMSFFILFYVYFKILNLMDILSNIHFSHKLLSLAGKVL